MSGLVGNGTNILINNQRKHINNKMFGRGSLRKTYPVTFPIQLGRGRGRGGAAGARHSHPFPQAISSSSHAVSAFAAPPRSIPIPCRENILIKKMFGRGRGICLFWEGAGGGGHLLIRLHHYSPSPPPNHPHPHLPHASVKT